jgi:Ca2+-binding EF-hand superfamily protein
MSCRERFDALDTNHDGKLTLEEFMAAPHRRGNPEEMFKAMDVSGRGINSSCTDRIAML